MARNSIRVFRPNVAYFLCVFLTLAMALFSVNCGGGVQVTSNPPMGTISVSASDPPSCRTPSGSFKHVYVTITSVQAHLSSTAADSTPGWQEIAPTLAAAPVQLDLLSTPQTGCVLAQLGANVALPAGDYQQIRLILLSNAPAGGTPTPANNQCGGGGFNCVVLSDDSIHILALSSQANTGLKIPPGQIAGGAIRVAAGQNTDLNIDFNTCASLVLQGNGQYRLKPTLTAGQVSANNTGLSGQVVDSATQLPIVGGQVLVAIEQPDSTGVDRIIMQAATDANGNFNFCPLPTGMFDVVAVAVDGAGIAYNATIALNVSAGTAMGKIPLIAETGVATGPGTIQGVVTSANAGAGASIDAAMSAMQTITLSGGGTRDVSIPLLGASTGNIATSATPVSVVCPVNTFCEQYTLIVPASNPSFGTFAAAGTTFSVPAVGSVLFKVEARAFRPLSGGTPTCSPASATVNQDSTSAPLAVTAGATVTAKQMDFTGCS
ncbi:MAG: DUF4382 domain-containing protein [Acidobacteria bacterium]|nr:DUF4382 domain-containing protein [Acidobacteriota bacterium]MCL5286398.1 DUF4382 domain-containing protein [Acidobacteriota bacterium]